MYPWLNKWIPDLGFTCSICVKQGKRKTQKNADNAFFHGCTRVRTDGLAKHQRMHENTTTQYGSANAGAMKSAQEELQKKNHKGLLNMLCTAFWLAKEMLAINKFPRMIRDLLPALTPTPAACQRTNESTTTWHLDPPLTSYFSNR
jgi:hypothetical protein